jgi:class 3 adenylate cyclase/pimeloyl-ACP methyl ester carboxylesterase
LQIDTMSTAEAPPETRFARSGSISIAYQVMGNSPLGLLIVPGMISHIEVMHEIPGYTDFLRRLARFATVVTFDKRGQGLSDRVAGAPTLEERADDVRAVMDAVGLERTALLGISEGSMMSVFFAAAHPDRVSHLMLYGGMPRQRQSEDFPIGFPENTAAMFGRWGTGNFVSKYAAPGWDGKPELIKLAAKFERLSCSPGNLKAFVMMNYDLDVRHILPSIRVPTLVLHRERDSLVPVELGRYYAEHIPDARLILYPSSGHWPPTHSEDWDTICDDIEEFVTGLRGVRAPQTERVLATVLFTDIVDSTRHASELGDARWRRKLDEHDRIMRRLIEQYRGRLVKSTGDGVMATFDGPGRAIRCATAIEPALAALQLSIRAGLHTGEVELRDGDVGGIAVHAAARVMQAAGAGEVLVSRVVSDLVAGSGIGFADRGEVTLKGLNGTWRLLVVTSS